MKKNKRLFIQVYRGKFNKRRYLSLAIVNDMKKILCFMLILFGLTSCVSFDAITFYDGVAYFGFDAIVSYDVYHEMHKNGVIDNAPVLIRVNGEKKLMSNP